jgi:hypothetical protein
MGRGRRPEEQEEATARVREMEGMLGFFFVLILDSTTTVIIRDWHGPNLLVGLWLFPRWAGIIRWALKSSFTFSYIFPISQLIFDFLCFKIAL